MQLLSCIISERKKFNILSLCIYSRENHFIHSKSYFWSVIDHLRAWKITLKEHLGRTAWGVAVHAVALVTWKNRSLHSACLFLPGILSHAQSIVSFTRGSTFPSKAKDSLLHLVAKKTDFWNKIFHNPLLNEHCILGHLLLPKRLKHVSLSRLPLTQPEPLLNTTGNATLTTILPWVVVTNLQVVPHLAARRRFVPC